jgi:hypothetical protein
MIVNAVMIMPIAKTPTAMEATTNPVRVLSCVIALGSVLFGGLILEANGVIPDMYGIHIAEQYVPNAGDAMSTYTAAGIAIQSNWYPAGDIYYSDEDNSGRGFAQVSRNQLDNELGMPGSDPYDPAVAAEAMKQRITLVVGNCNKSGEITCSSTDIFIASALAQNGPGFTSANLKDLLNSPNRKEFDANNPNQALLPWESDWFNLGDKKNRDYDRFMLKLFSNDVKQLNRNNWYTPDVDWDYIHNLYKGGWRSKW